MILHRKNGSSRVTTRRRVYADGSNMQRRRWLVIATALMVPATIAGAIFAGIPFGTGNTPVTVGTNSSTVSLTVTGCGCQYAPGGGVATALQPDTVAPNTSTDTGNGSDQQVIYWTVSASAAAVIQTAAASPQSEANGDAVNFTGASDIVGCSASWFVVSPPMVTTAGNTTLAQDVAAESPLVGTALASGQHVTVFSTVYLYDSTGSTVQNGCEGSSPSVQLAIN